MLKLYHLNLNFVQMASQVQTGHMAITKTDFPADYNDCIPRWLIPMVSFPYDSKDSFSILFQIQLFQIIQMSLIIQMATLWFNEVFPHDLVVVSMSIDSRSHFTSGCAYSYVLRVFPEYLVDSSKETFFQMVPMMAFPGDSKDNFPS